MTHSSHPGRKRPSRNGALFILSVLMIGSATLRLGLYAGPAIAREPAKQEAPEMKSPDSAIPSAPGSKELRLLLEALGTRERRVMLREKQNQDRTKALEIADRAIEARIDALKAAEQNLAATLALADVASENDVALLTSFYDRMKPKQAAALFETMDPEFAAGFLARMRPESAATILAGLSPMAAYSISVVLAGRNSAAPKE